MVSAWGGYVFIINLVPLHVFTLLLMGRYSTRIYVAYNTFFVIGLLCSMQIPFVGFQPVKTSEHMASAGEQFLPVVQCAFNDVSFLLSAGVFALLQAVAFFKYLQGFLSKNEFKYFFVVTATLAAGVVLAVIVGLTWSGFIAPWSGR